MKSEDLAGKLSRHALWWRGVDGGERANLSGANLCSADLSGANLSGANLCSADLSGADLRSANLRSADLSSADLSGADLRSADLRSADLRSANLSETILDSALPANKESSAFTRDPDGMAIAYRTRTSTHVGTFEYLDGEWYSAPVFSVCPLTECHPGLYVWPTIEAARAWQPGSEIIEVRCDPDWIHGVKGKWRVPRFVVVGSVKP